jgi:hypothetical protein
VPGDCHDRTVASLGLGKLGDRMVPQIVKSQPGQRTLYFLEVSLALRVYARLRGTLLASASRALN